MNLIKEQLTRQNIFTYSCTSSYSACVVYVWYIYSALYGACRVHVGCMYGENTNFVRCLLGACVVYVQYIRDQEYSKEEP